MKDQDIVQLLTKYNEEVCGRGETLPEQQQIFRVKVVKAFLQAGVPLSKIRHFCELLEENGYRPNDKRHLFDLIHLFWRKKNRISSYQYKENG